MVDMVRHGGAARTASAATATVAVRQYGGETMEVMGGRVL